MTGKQNVVLCWKTTDYHQIIQTHDRQKPNGPLHGDKNKFGIWCRYFFFVGEIPEFQFGLCTGLSREMYGVFGTGLLGQGFRHISWFHAGTNGWDTGKTSEHKTNFEQVGNGTLVGFSSPGSQGFPWRYRKEVDGSLALWTQFRPSKSYDILTERRVGGDARGNLLSHTAGSFMFYTLSTNGFVFINDSYFLLASFFVAVTGFFRQQQLDIYSNLSWCICRLSKSANTSMSSPTLPSRRVCRTNTTMARLVACGTSLDVPSALWSPRCVNHGYY